MQGLKPQPLNAGFESGWLITTGLYERALISKTRYSYKYQTLCRACNKISWQWRQDLVRQTTKSCCHAGKRKHYEPGQRINNVVYICQHREENVLLADVICSDCNSMFTVQKRELTVADYNNHKLRCPTCSRKIVQFLSRVEITNECCWIWKGATDKVSGLGKFLNGMASHWIYERVKGPCAGRKLISICGNRKCVNPRHLQLGTGE